MKLEKGMYVRTKDGEIFDCHVGEQMGKPIYYPKKSKTNGYIDWNEVYKQSENIIDVLEVGDYVNGYKVTEIDPITFRKEAYPNFWSNKIINDSDIKSIVTKEQFKQMEYKVGE